MATFLEGQLLPEWWADRGRAGEDDPELSSLLLSILWPGPKLADKKLRKGVHRDQSPRIQSEEKNGWGGWGGRKK